MKRRVTVADLADLVGDFGEGLFSRMGDERSAKAIRDAKGALKSGQFRRAAESLARLKNEISPAKPRIYVASSLDDIDRARTLADALVGRGFELTYRWMDHGPVAKDGPARMAEVAANELLGVAAADAVIVLLPGGRGTHVELGAALALDKTIFLCAHENREPGSPCAFYFHPAVTVVRYEKFEQLPSLVEDAYRRTADKEES